MPDPIATPTLNLAEFGSVAEIKLHKKGGYGFIKFALHDSAVRAIVQVHHRELQGRVSSVFNLLALDPRILTCLTDS